MTYYSDGFTLESNPSSKGGGYTVTNDQGDVVIHQKIEKEHFTNNEAELLALKAALEIANKGDCIIIDSKLIFGLVCKNWKFKKRPDLIETQQKARDCWLQKNIEIIWKPREVNLAGRYNERFEDWLIFNHNRL